MRKNYICDYSLRLKWVPDETDSSSQYKPPTLKRTFRKKQKNSLVAKRSEKHNTDDFEIKGQDLEIQDEAKLEDQSFSIETQLSSHPTKLTLSSETISAQSSVGVSTPSLWPLASQTPSTGFESNFEDFSSKARLKSISEASGFNFDKVTMLQETMKDDTTNDDVSVQNLHSEVELNSYDDSSPDPVQGIVYSSTSQSSTASSPSTLVNRTADAALIVASDKPSSMTAISGNIFEIVNSNIACNPYLPLHIKFNQGEFFHYQNLINTPGMSRIVDHIWNFVFPQYYPTMLQPINVMMNCIIPIFIRNPSNMYAIVSLCAFQLSILDPNFRRIAVQNKIESNLTLREMLIRKERFSRLDILGVLLIQLGLESVDCRAGEWKPHMDLAHQLIRPLLMPSVSNGVEKFCAFRLARYDTFDSLFCGKEPVLRLEQLNNEAFEHEIASIWGIRPIFPVICSELSYCANCLYTRQQVTEDDYLKMKYFAQYLFKELPLKFPEYGKVENSIEFLWKAVSILFYGFISLSYFNFEEITSLTTTLHMAINCLKQFPKRHILTSILSTPLFICGLSARDPFDQNLISEVLLDIFKDQIQPQFLMTSEYCHKIWEYRERNNGRFTHQDFYNLRESLNWVSLII